MTQHNLPKSGDRVRMTGVMPNDPDPIPVSLEGTVTEVNADVHQIYVDWDADETGRKRTLILLTDDPFEVLPRQDDVRVCGRCGDRIRWDGQKWSTDGDPLEPCLPGLGREHRPSPL